MTDTPLPLADIRVLDLTHARAGPTAVRQLADWGADVIKIEVPPEPGSDNDGVGGSRSAPDYLNLHRNKRSLTLDLKNPDGHRIFIELVAKADVVVENFRAEVKHRLGVDYDSLKVHNPGLIYGSISGFGQDGPYSNRAGVDQIAQGILLALIERGRTGEGQWVHTSLLEAMISMLDFQAARWLIDQDVAGQAGNDHPTGIPMGVFPCSDGAINIAAPGGRLWERLLDHIGVPELAEDERFATAGARSKNRELLNAKIGAITATRSSAEWVEELNAVGVPCGPINSIDQTFADPQVEHLGIAWPMQHPERGNLRIVGQPVHLEGAERPQSARLPTPGAGQHSDEILDALGYDADAVADLRSRRVI